MGLTHVNIKLTNGLDLGNSRSGRLNEDEIRSIQVNALVDTGALMLCINEELRDFLGLLQTDSRLAQLADGTIKKLEVVGPIEVTFEDRRTSVDAMVLLGAFPLEDMDLLVDPQRQQLIGNPEHPFSAMYSLK